MDSRIKVLNPFAANIKKYHELRTANAAGVLALGRAYFRAKNYEAATTWLKLAAANPETAVPADYLLGKIASQEERLDDALAILNHDFALRPDQPDSLAEVGLVYLQLRKYPEAARYFERAIALDPQHCGKFQPTATL